MFSAASSDKNVGMKKRSLLFPIAALLSLIIIIEGCSSKEKLPKTPPTEQASQAKLSYEDATQRASVIKSLSYELGLILKKESEFFNGSVVSHFEVSNLNQDLFFDFQNGKVIFLSVNGHVIDNISHSDGRISVPLKYLVIGKNQTKIIYESPYSREGHGLYRFKDPEDNRIYLYTDFEPFKASQLFPCFDQPDLKAEITLQVTAPAEWHVISTMRESKVIKTGTNESIWSFPRTPKLSTYVFSMHAGEYKMWSSKADHISLRLFARHSLAKYVDPNEWFTTTKQGFRFFNEYFDYPYPFKKYDQLIVPDFNWGGMENIAAVTFSERYISRGKKTIDEKEDLADVLLHEMAHMWFGNLVTMKWWNDLWLNESFATYMATLALAEATPFKNSWLSFNTSAKSWGYWEDQLVTTHPIESPIQDTSQALTAFDGISYGKGASVLKQISFFVGPEQFKKGVSNYFKKYQYANAERKDFMNMLGREAGQNMEDWSRQWLNKAGVDQVKVDWKCGPDGRITSFALEQKPPNGETDFRSHRTQIGLYNRRGNQIVLTQKLTATYHAPRTEIKEMLQLECSELINPNEGDHDFVVSILDEQTIKNLKKNISLVKDPLARIMFWTSLYEMVRTAQLSVKEFAQIALKELPNEKHQHVRKNFFRFWLGSLPRYYPISTEQEKNQRLQFVTQLEQLLWTQARSSKSGSDMQKEYFDALIQIVETSGMLLKLDQILQGSLKLPGLVLDQDRRWDILFPLMANSYPTAVMHLAEEKKRDPSEEGIKSALKVEAARNYMQNKTKIFNDVVSDQTTLSHGRLRAVLRGLFPPVQDSLKRKFARQFYENLDRMLLKRSDTFLEAYSENIAPFNCDTESIAEATAFLNSHSNLSPIVSKALKVGRQETERCVKIRERARL